MHADLKGALSQINKSYRCFTHKGKSMSKSQVSIVLQYGIQKGYETTADFKDGEIDEILNLK